MSDMCFLGGVKSLPRISRTLVAVESFPVVSRLHQEGLSSVGLVGTSGFTLEGDIHITVHMC